MSSTMSRRALLSGLGAASGVAALGAAASPASAAPRPAPSAEAGGRIHPDTPPALPAPITSDPEHGVSYRFVNWNDWVPENNTTYGRTFGGFGAYTSVSADRLSVFVDTPQGAHIHDVEFYLKNSVDVELHGITWVSGQGSYPSPFWLVVTEPANTTLHASRYAVPTDVNGPFPFGCRIGVSVPTTTDGGVQVDGVRFGFTNAPRSTVLLPEPIRAYDSTKHRPLKGGQKHAVSLEGQIPSYASAAIIALSAVGTHGHGLLHIDAHGGSLKRIALQWGHTGDRVTAEVTTPVSPAGIVEVASKHGSGHTDFQVDVVGYLA